MAELVIWYKGLGVNSLSWGLGPVSLYICSSMIIFITNSYGDAVGIKDQTPSSPSSPSHRCFSVSISFSPLHQLFGFRRPACDLRKLICKNSAVPHGCSDQRHSYWGIFPSRILLVHETILYHDFNPLHCIFDASITSGWIRVREQRKFVLVSVIWRTSYICKIKPISQITTFSNEGRCKN